MPSKSSQSLNSYREQRFDNPNSQIFITKFFQPRNGLLIFSFLLLFVYAVIPLAAYIFLGAGTEFLKLTLIIVLGVVAMWIGSSLPLCDKRFKAETARIKVSGNLFHVVIWTTFLVFITITLITAPAIPLISAFQGETANELSQNRGDFLKGRVGAEIVLMYVSTLFTTTLIPYSIITLYVNRSKFRYIATSIFFLFCISFLAKSLFLNLALPFLVYLAITNRLTKKVFAFGLGVSMLIILLSTILSLGNDTFDSADAAEGSAIPTLKYLSASHMPATSLDYAIWRAFSVPIYTATDTLLVHERQFESQPLLGATSSLLSAIFGLERINLERYVFEYQFGSWNDIANANAVFIVDAYANFSYIGVIIFGIFVGQIFRWFRLSPDIGFKSLWLLFCFSLFNASFIGLMLSNGFAYLIFHALFLKIIYKPKSKCVN